MTSSTKFVAFAAFVLLLNVHWTVCQCYPGFPGYACPAVYSSCDDDSSLDTILPILILALCNNNRGGCGGGFGGYGGYGGCGCGCGCGCCNGCGCCGNCNC